MRAGFASCHRMGGDLFFKPSGLFFPRLTDQHPLSLWAPNRVASFY